MKISIGCDHGALALKDKLVTHLQAKGHEVKDFGTYTLDSCDYPDLQPPLPRQLPAANVRRALSFAPPASAFPSPPTKLTASAALCFPI